MRPSCSPCCSVVRLKIIAVTSGQKIAFAAPDPNQRHQHSVDLICVADVRLKISVPTAGRASDVSCSVRQNSASQVVGGIQYGVTYPSIRCPIRLRISEGQRAACCDCATSVKMRTMPRNVCPISLSIVYVPYISSACPPERIHTSPESENFDSLVSHQTIVGSTPSVIIAQHCPASQ